MSWTIIFSGTFIILYGLGSYFWIRKSGWRLNEKTSGWLRYSHYVLTALAILAGILIVMDDISF